MTKEIIVNAGELESRVAILENGRLMELHVERDPKIVGNIYQGRVTKVLKGMDAAFVDIGVERNAFLSAADVVQEIDEDGGSGHGRGYNADFPPINTLLHAGQEILVQVVRAPMGTKGARITTRLSLPGRYMVLMLNSGSHVGVSRKIEDDKERARLRAIAGKLRPNQYSLIVRTEAEGKSDEELQGDLNFLMDMAKRIEQKAAQTHAPALVHGDLALIFRIIRDAFTRDVDRVVVDAPDTYENVIELVGMMSPGLKNRVFFYDERMPVFHAYNIEAEIERTLRRRVWLPSGGNLIVDQAEALTTIDVNTGRFVGTIELSETVLTTNLQAAEEVARQLRLRDIGGIIVIDFIDMDNARHRAQVTKAFEEALHRDRAKFKVHNISQLGLVEMTRKRTGESLAGLLTEPCPYCSGIGRVQTALTMALRVDRELAAMAVAHPETESFLVTAHSRVIASMLGYEGEAHRDLEQYVGHPIYLRVAEDYHPNTYRLEHLTLEQALAAITHLEEGDVIEGQVVNPDPELSLSTLVLAKDMFLVVPDLGAQVGARVKVRVREVTTSLAFAEPLAEEQRLIRTGDKALPMDRPPLVPEQALPLYLREERSTWPPRGLQLLSPTAEAVILPAEEAENLPMESESRDRRRKKTQPRNRREAAVEVISAPEEQIEPLEEQTTPNTERLPEAAPTSAEEDTGSGTTGSHRRRHRRRNRRETASTTEAAPEAALAGTPMIPVPNEPAGATAGGTPVIPIASVTAGGTPAIPVSEVAPEMRTRKRRRRGGVRHRAAREAAASHFTPVEATSISSELPAPIMPPLEELQPAEAVERMNSILQSLPDTQVEESKEALPPARRRTTRRPRAVAGPAPSTTGEVTEPPAAPPEVAPITIETPTPEDAPKPRRRRTPRKVTPDKEKGEE